MKWLLLVYTIGFFTVAMLLSVGIIENKQPLNETASLCNILGFICLVGYSIHVKIEGDK